MRRDSAAPGLLVAFFAGTLAMVLALWALLREGSDWVDFAALALLLAVAAVLLVIIMRELRQDEPPGDDEREAGR
jgi:hypothetical protein